MSSATKLIRNASKILRIYRRVERVHRQVCGQKTSVEHQLQTLDTRILQLAHNPWQTQTRPLSLAFIHAGTQRIQQHRDQHQQRLEALDEKARDLHSRKLRLRCYHSLLRQHALRKLHQSLDQEP